MISNIDWRAHFEQCHRNPDTFKEARRNAEQSRDPRQLQRSAHLCKLNDYQNSGGLQPSREIIIFLQMNYYILFINFKKYNK